MPIKMVVGLGNPGKKYESTRHNIGARIVRFLKDPEIRMPQGIVLVVPADEGVFMNNCGQVVASRARMDNCAAEEILVVCDDFMLPFPQLRIRSKGSSGGHNGLQSILDWFKTSNIPRLRVGVGSVPPGKDPAEYVLENFQERAAEVQTGLVARGANAVVDCVTQGLEAAMNRYNPKAETP